MDILKRILMIASMLALTSFAADKGTSLFKVSKQEKSQFYDRAITLYKDGCKNIEKGFVSDTNKCIAAFGFLNRIVKYDDNTFDANFYLSQIYIYQPQSFNWSAKSKTKQELNKIGAKHLRKALKMNPNHIEAKTLYSKIKQASSESTQGL